MRIADVLRRRADTHQKGQILVIVGAGMIAMLAMAGLVTDTGIAWANRRQAQNVADAAAMAGTRIIAVDRYEKVYDPTATPTFANPGTAIQQAIIDAFQYNANSGQTFDALTWGTAGSPEYTDYKGRRFPNADFAVGPYYVQAGAIPGEAQGVYVPAKASSNTLVIRVIGIDTIANAVDATAVAGPHVPLGKLLPLVVRDRYTHCINSSEELTGTCDAAAVRPPLPGVTPYQRTYQEGCVYRFRDVNPTELPCNGSTDPSFPDLVTPDYAGSFGWIDWDGGNSPTSDLNPWIGDPSIAPTGWYTTVCADPATSVTCRVDQGTLPSPEDDLFWRLDGSTGNRNVSISLTGTMYLGDEIYVPIWRDAETGSGTNAIFEIKGFAVFEVVQMYTAGSSQGFDGRFVGSFRGGSIQQCTIVPSSCPGSASAPLPFAVNLAR